MQKNAQASLEPSPEQMRYAVVLARGMYCGLVCLFVTFALYVLGIMDARIPHEQLPELWQLSVHEYLAEANIEAGWSWVTMLAYGDFVNFIGIALLAGVTVPCYLAIIPLFLKNKEMIYALLALLEVIVLVVAASGIIAIGH